MSPYWIAAALARWPLCTNVWCNVITRWAIGCGVWLGVRFGWVLRLVVHAGLSAW